MLLFPKDLTDIREIERRFRLSDCVQVGILTESTDPYSDASMAILHTKLEERYPGLGDVVFLTGNISSSLIEDSDKSKIIYSVHVYRKK